MINIYPHFHTLNADVLYVWCNNKGVAGLIYQQILWDLFWDFRFCCEAKNFTSHPRQQANVNTLTHQTG